MFGQRKEQKTCEQEAEAVYAVLLDRALMPVFYERYSVPDTFEGRFDLLLLHVFMVMHTNIGQSDGEAFNQALFDVMFADMDQSLREGGKGDMGVPKQMRYMMKAFNGRMNRYEETFAEPAAFSNSLVLNLFNGEEPSEDIIAALDFYVRDNVAYIKAQGVDRLHAGHVTLRPIKE